MSEKTFSKSRRRPLQVLSSSFSMPNLEVSKVALLFLYLMFPWFSYFSLSRAQSAPLTNSAVVLCSWGKDTDCLFLLCFSFFLAMCAFAERNRSRTQGKRDIFLRLEILQARIIFLWESIYSCQITTQLRDITQAMTILHFDIYILFVKEETIGGDQSWWYNGCMAFFLLFIYGTHPNPDWIMWRKTLPLRE